MRLNRVHVDAHLAPGVEVALPETVANHLVRVLRLGLGAPLVLFNGDGSDYDATLVALGKREARVEVRVARAVTRESPLRITLAQAVARGEKMDWVLQKATELGVACVQPVITERTEVRLDAERGDRRREHWLGVVVAACEQCGRAQLPELGQVMTLRDWLAGRTVPGWYLDPTADASIGTVGSDAPALVIGPEGGLGERDLGALRGAGFLGVRFGPRVLRTETAGVAALAALQALRGDLA